MAQNHSPFGTAHKRAVAIDPEYARQIRSVFRVFPRSARTPKSGAQSATRRLAVEFPKPRSAVLVLTSVPMLQYFLKNSGKKPAITVVANVELAQSYMAQPHTAFGFDFTAIFPATFPTSTKPRAGADGSPGPIDDLKRFQQP